ncbi:hypothetical protein QQ020_13915 [Fulvivirgaceae bacterium BMA12]|uniref:Uncharacterized protein n=1 Tax=Agaribacillus aureus TaxID=3051825 RepID=A0ABT8L5Y7_9BACT|nr:hypothetical protein [Fulvivirgaceae bacterium BMA12]
MKTYRNINLFYFDLPYCSFTLASVFVGGWSPYMQVVNSAYREYFDIGQDREEMGIYK